MLGGVCAGLAEYFDVDPSLIRLATVILLFAGGTGILAYIVAWIIIPQEPLVSKAESTESVSENRKEVTESPDKSKFIVGIILIALGFLFLMNTLNVWTWFSFFRLWPVLLIVIGLVVILKGLERGGASES
jgi:phage shock protein PspC (stress-responsive transcriptional regulator)